MLIVQDSVPFPNKLINKYMNMICIRLLKKNLSEKVVIFLYRFFPAIRLYCFLLS